MTSGHKWIGAPIPCGVYLMRNKYRIMPPDDTPIYVGSPDTTFAGSRNALSCAVLWTYISSHSYEEQVQKVIRCLDLANYAYMKLKKLEKDIQNDLWVTHSVECSLSVYFRQPNKHIVYKYSLSDEVLLVKGEKRKHSHMYFMEHVTYARIDELIEDLHQHGAFPPQDPEHAGKQIKQWFQSQPGFVVQTGKEQQVRPLMLVPAIGRGFK